MEAYATYSDENSYLLVLECQEWEQATRTSTIRHNLWRGSLSVKAERGVIASGEAHNAYRNPLSPAAAEDCLLNAMDQLDSLIGLEEMAFLHKWAFELGEPDGERNL